jgi:hypothetical protein
VRGLGETVEKQMVEKDYEPPSAEKRHRDSESSARARSLSSRTGSCSLSPGSCYSYYLSLDGDIEKIYPIRSWSDGDVWSYLRTWRNRLLPFYSRIADLFVLWFALTLLFLTQLISEDLVSGLFLMPWEVWF